jgi:adenosylcobinamide kinase/adenosylcobinamide-phosphate guanylyltransferase
MSLVVFTGGARSGKSTAAQDLARSRQLRGARVVVAVFGRESDAEMAERIARHQIDRPDGFETLAVSDPSAWLEDIGDDALLVVDCLGTLVGRVMEVAWEGAAGERMADADTTLPVGLEADVTASVADLVERLSRRTADTIVVTNEVGDGVVPAYPSGRLFRDALGSANRALIDRADGAYLCVAGKLIDLAALPRHATWPED